MASCFEKSYESYYFGNNIYRIAGIFHGVKFSWMMQRFAGRIFVECGHFQQATCGLALLCILIPREKYPLYGISLHTVRDYIQMYDARRNWPCLQKFDPQFISVIPASTKFNPAINICYTVYNLL